MSGRTMFLFPEPPKSHWLEVWAAVPLPLLPYTAQWKPVLDTLLYEIRM